MIRPVRASRRERLPLSGVLATVFLERLFDMFSVLLLLGLVVLLGGTAAAPFIYTLF